jgi:lipoyl(octanoyl) transferase
MTSMTQADELVSDIGEWRQDFAPVPYRAALAEQDARNAAIAAGEARELVWLLEHPPVYTAETSAALPNCSIRASRWSRPGAAGDTLYHRPGQRVAYVLLDLARSGAATCAGSSTAVEGWVIGDAWRTVGVEAWAVP